MASSWDVGSGGGQGGQGSRPKRNGFRGQRRTTDGQAHSQSQQQRERNQITYFRPNSRRFEISHGGEVVGANRRNNTSSSTFGDSWGLTPAQQKFNYYMYEFVVEGTPEPPFVFEPLETDENVKACQFMRELREERQLTEGLQGIMDCRGLHSNVRMCQFCDGRRGPWAKDNNKKPPNSDIQFQRYQASFSNTYADYGKRNKRQDSDEEDNVFKTTRKLGPEEIDAVDDVEYGVSSMRLSVVE